MQTEIEIQIQAWLCIVFGALTAAGGADALSHFESQGPGVQGTTQRAAQAVKLS